MRLLLENETFNNNAGISEHQTINMVTLMHNFARGLKANAFTKKILKRKPSDGHFQLAIDLGVQNCDGKRGSAGASGGRGLFFSISWA